MLRTVAPVCDNTTFVCRPYTQANVDNAADKEKEPKNSQKQLEATKEGKPVKSKALKDSKELEVCSHSRK